MQPRTLGDILTADQLIATAQLEQAQRAADRSGTPLIVVLLDQGLISEDKLFEALQANLDFKVFNPVETEIDIDAVREIPVEDANRFRLLPVRVSRRAGRRVLVVAMSDPLDRQCIEEIEFSTGCVVEPMIGRPSDIVEAIRSHYRSVATKIISRERLNTPAPRSGRAIFGGKLSDNALRTRPMRRVQQEATPAHRIDALVALLVRKGVISQDEYEDQLKALVHPSAAVESD